MLEINKIHYCNCIEGMKQIEDNSVDITITSPPYNAGKNVRGNFYSKYSDDLNQDDYYDFISGVLRELIRVTKNYVFFNFQILANNKKAYLKIISEFQDNIKEIIIWHKKQVQPAIQPTVLSSAFEFVIVFSDNLKAEKRAFERCFFNNREKGQLNKNIIYGDNSNCEKLDKNKSDNKAVFPKYFVRWFIDKFSQEGDLILDPFMGSGTTAIVAKENKRNYIGFEIDQNYIKEAQRRLNQKQLTQFKLK